MFAVGGEVSGSWFLSSGGNIVAFFIVLLLLTIFLTAQCSDCKRYSYKLRDLDVDSRTSSLVRVVKLDEGSEVKVNPAIGEIRSDEVNVAEKTPPTDLWANGSRAVITTVDSNAASENAVPFTPWRSHLRAPESRDPNSTTLPDSAHIYQGVGDRRSIDNTVPTDQEPGAEPGAEDMSSLYAQVIKRAGPTQPRPLPQVEG